MDLLQFLGRFHVLIVHFPIALLALAAVFHLLNRKGKYETYQSGVNKLLLIGVFSAVLSTILGLMLAKNGGYDEAALLTHKRSGIILTVLSILAWGSTRKQYTANERVQSVVSQSLMGLVLVFVLLTGHYGGNLTHGAEYLFDNAPQFVRTVAGFPPRPVPRPPVTNLDSAQVYLDLIEPVLRRRCVSCHSESKTKGELRMTSHAGLLKGGESGPSVVASNLKESELFRRVTLSQDEEDFMPPDGKTPLSDDEVSIIEWWIQQGAPEEGKLADLTIEKDIRPAMERYFGLGAGKEAFPLPAISPLDIAKEQELEQAGFMINTLSAENNYLDIDMSTSGQEVTTESLRNLLKVKEQITWLNLAGCSLTDEHLEIIGQLTNLTKLNLSRNPAITEKGTAHLQKLEHLEYLNLYATGVGDPTLEHVKALPHLRSVFLWQSNVTPEKAAELRNARSGLTVDIGEREV